MKRSRLFSLILVMPFAVIAFLFVAGISLKSFAVDSSSITAPIIPNPNIQYVGTTATATPVSISGSGVGGFASLPACPATISACPDINSSSSNPATCPQMCTVTQNPEGYGIWLGGTLAVCPAGYAAVAVYNPQIDVVYNTTTATVWPTDIDNMHYYEALGYTCDSNQSSYTGGYATFSDPRGPTFAPPLPLGLWNDWWVNRVLNITGLQTGYGGGAYPWPQYYYLYTYYTVSCSISPGWIMYGYTRPTNNPGNNITFNSSSSTVEATGVAQANNAVASVPESVVCARVTPTWQHH